MPDHTKPGKKKIILVSFIVLLVASVLGGLGYLYLNYESIIKDKLESSLPETVSVDFKSLAISPLNGTATIENLTVLFQPENPAGRFHSVNIAKVRATGVGIVGLIIRDRLTMDSLIITGGKIVVDNVLLKDSTGHAISERSEGVESIDIGLLDLDEIGFLLKGDSANECTFTTSITLERMAIDLSEPVRWGVIAGGMREMVLDSLLFNPQDGMYKYAAGRIGYIDQRLSVNSFSVTSKYPRFEFAHRKGKQIDVFDIGIDSIALAGVHPGSIADSLFEAESISINGASLYVFRDRRMPFIKDHEEALPIQLLKKLPYAVRVGSVEIKDAGIVYEEFPEEGSKSGRIAFSDVDAHFGRIDNRIDTFNTFINLTVKARFMESGLLKAKFAFPMHPRNLYYAEGTLDNFELTSLNPTLEHLARVRIESGKMNSMSFNFDYDNDVSNGSMILLYEDLEMTALKEKQSETVANKVKSFFLNVLFAKRNKDDEVRMAKRNGTIQFERDKKRSIFNYWWKSLATGIKSSHSINDILTSERKHEEIKK